MKCILYDNTKHKKLLKSGPFVSILFFILNLPCTLFAQDELAAFKLALKNAAHDTTKCRLLAHLAEIAPEGEWQAYNQQLFEITKANTGKHSSQSVSLNRIYKKYHATALENLGVISAGTGNVSAAMGYYRESLRIRTDLGFKQGIAYAHHNIGTVYLNLGYADSAITEFNKSLDILNEIRDTAVFASLYNNIGSAYYNLGNIELALLFFGRSLKLYEQSNDLYGIANTLSSIGGTYYSQGELVKALENFQRSLKLQEEINDPEGVAYSTHNISAMLLSLGRVDEAKKFAAKSLTTSTQIENKKGIALALSDLGKVFEANGKLFAANEKDSAALNYFSRALRLYEEVKDKDGESVILNSIAGLYYRNGQSKAAGRDDFTNALRFALEGLQVAREIGYPENIRNAAEIAKNIYSEKRDYKNALTMFEVFVQMRDSLVNEETRKASIKNQLKYEFEKKAAADSVKHEEERKVTAAQMAAQQARLKQDKIQRYSLIAGLLFVACCLIFVINRFRLTKKQKQIIEEQKLKVDDAFEKLHEKNKEVMDSIYYARRIQNALLTSERYIGRQLKKMVGRN